jgi:hypothetical protein
MDESQFPKKNALAYSYIRNVLKYNNKSHFYRVCDDVINYMEDLSMKGYYEEANRNPDMAIQKPNGDIVLYWRNRKYDLPSMIIVSKRYGLEDFDFLDMLVNIPDTSITKIWLRGNEHFREGDLPYKITIGGRMHFTNQYCKANIKYQANRILKKVLALAGCAAFTCIGVKILESLNFIL